MPSTALQNPSLTPPCGKRIMLALRQVMKEVDTHSRQLMKQHDITVAQLVCLSELYTAGALTLSTLSKNVHLSGSTVVGIVDRLEEKGLLKRKRDQQDRRVYHIALTSKGREFMDSSPDLLHHRLDDQLENLQSPQQEAIAQALEKLVVILQAH